MSKTASPIMLGQFEVKQTLGSGAFGHVYQAVDIELKRSVAIKVLRPEINDNPALAERFRVEAVSLARLNHPNITTLFALQRQDRQLFLVMELVGGQTLETVLEQKKRLSLEQAQAVVAQIATGLGYAHSMDVIHRDIKPANVMLTESGLVKIMDFGIARIRGTQRLTRSGLLGTYAYLAPEQFKGGEGSERSDLYALACVFYEMMSGEIPFDASSEAEIMRGHLEAPPRSLRDRLPSLDPAIDRALLRALAKNPEDRFPSVEAFAVAIGAAELEKRAPAILRDLLASLPRTARPTTILSDSSQDLTRLSGDPQGMTKLAMARWLEGAAALFARPMVRVGLLAAAGLFLVGGALVLFWPDQSDPDFPPPPSRPSSSSPLYSAGEASGRPSPQKVGTFISTHQHKPEALWHEAQLRLKAGLVEDALSLLGQAAEDRFVPAYVSLARLYDPGIADRPAILPPNEQEAADKYRRAIRAGDLSVTQDRQALLDRLKQKRDSSDPSVSSLAQQIIRKFWDENER